MQTILEMPYWTKKGVMKNEIPRTTVELSLHELSLHGKEVFQKVSPQIIKAAREKINYYPEMISWEALFDETCLWSSDYVAKNMGKGYYSKNEMTMEQAIELSQSR